MYYHQHVLFDVRSWIRLVLQNANISVSVYHGVRNTYYIIPWPTWVSSHEFLSLFIEINYLRNRTWNSLSYVRNAYCNSTKYNNWNKTKPYNYKVHQCFVSQLQGDKSFLLELILSTYFISPRSLQNWSFSTSSSNFLATILNLVNFIL